MNLIKIAFEAFILGILPPMYLFAHLYYTDILSITMVLGMFLFNKKERHNVGAVFGNIKFNKKWKNENNNNHILLKLIVIGLLSVLMRQTNIVWVGMVLGGTVMDKLVSQTLPFLQSGSEKRSTVLYSYRVIVNKEKILKKIIWLNLTNLHFQDMISVFAFYCKR